MLQLQNVCNDSADGREKNEIYARVCYDFLDFLSPPRLTLPCDEVAY